MRRIGMKLLALLLVTVSKNSMQHYKVQRGNWPKSIWPILFFILFFELVSYFLFAPILQTLHLL